MIRRTKINDISFSKKELIKTKNQVLDMSSTSSFKEISDFVLQEVMKLTGSKYCYVAYVDPENEDSVGISFTKMTPECDIYEKIGEARFPVKNMAPMEDF